MLTYKVAYWLRMGTFFAEVLDFPEVTAVGHTVAETRINILNTLRYTAERHLRHGGSMPPPCMAEANGPICCCCRSSAAR